MWGDRNLQFSTVSIKKEKKKKCEVKGGVRESALESLPDYTSALVIQTGI